MHGRRPTLGSVQAGYRLLHGEGPSCRWTMIVFARCWRWRMATRCSCCASRRTRWWTPPGRSRARACSPTIQPRIASIPREPILATRFQVDLARHPDIHRGARRVERRWPSRPRKCGPEVVVPLGAGSSKLGVLIAVESATSRPANAEAARDCTGIVVQTAARLVELAHRLRPAKAAGEGPRPDADADLWCRLGCRERPPPTAATLRGPRPAGS